MARRDKTPSIFERKLAALSDESERLEGSIRDLSKTIKKIETTGESAYLQPPKPGPRLQRTTFSSLDQRGQPPMPAAEPEVASPAPERSALLSDAPDEVENPAADPEPQSGYLPGFAGAKDLRKPTPPKNEKFASYLASGSFGKAGKPLAHEKKLQRNKAIFMLVVAGLVIYILYKTLF